MIESFLLPGYYLGPDVELTSYVFYRQFAGTSRLAKVKSYDCHFVRKDFPVIHRLAMQVGEWCNLPIHSLQLT